MENGRPLKAVLLVTSLLITVVFVSNMSLAEKKEAEKLTFENTILPYEKLVSDIDYLYQSVDFNANLQSDNKVLADLQSFSENKFQSIINDENNFKKIKALRDEYIKDKVKGEKRDIVEKWYKYLDRFIVLDPAAKKLQQDEITAKNKLSSVFNVYRPKMKDKDGKFIKDPQTKKEKLFNTSAINTILATSKDRDERKRAFEAKSQVGFEIMQKGFREIIKLRNEYAKVRGFKDYYSMKYIQSGLDEDKLIAMFDKIVADTDQVTKNAVAKYLLEEKLDKFEPWDADYASMGFSSLVDDYLPKEGMTEVLKASYKALGFDLDKFNIKMDLEPKPGKYPHAACWWVKFADLEKKVWKGDEMKLLANLDKGGVEQYSTLFHEAGHAVHGANVRQKYVIDKNVNLTSYYELGGFAEGVAFTFEKLTADKDWFLKYANFNKPNKTADEINKIKEAYSKYEAKAKPWEAFNYRNLLTKVYFERAIYKNPDADFNKIWWDTMQKLLFVERHDDLPFWAHKVHFITPAVYYQDYIIADLISEQNMHYFKKKYGKFVDNPKIGKLMIEKYFKPGNSIAWEDMLKNLTGEKLNPQYKIDAITKF